MKTLPGYVIYLKHKKERRFIRNELIRTANQYLGICEQLRFVYDTVDQLEDAEIKDLLIEQLIDAFSMGKKMSARLVYYGQKYKDKTGHRGRNIIWLDHSRARRNIRRRRKI